MIDVDNFKTLVEALEALPEDIRNNRVDMSSAYEPSCKTPGCFAGLLSIVAEDIPEFKKLYGGTGYFFHDWVKAVNAYLDCDFRHWAKHNPITWDNPNGWEMFNSIIAFGKERGETLTHNEIIVHLRGVYDRWDGF